jgi:hypothetical protein
MSYRGYKPRWGRLREIDKRCKVGTEAWKARHTTPIQKLSAWRLLHLQQPHKAVSKAAGIKPSSNMPLKKMVKIAGRTSI